MSQPIQETLEALPTITAESMAAMTDAQLLAWTNELLAVQAQDRQMNQLRYYQPVSAKARAIHTCTKKIIGVGGGNGACLPLTAPVMMADGTTRPLGEIQIGDRVMAADPLTREAMPATVTNTFRSGVQEVYRVTCSDGGSFDATANHQVPLLLGSHRLTTKGHAKIPKKRRLGDYLDRIRACAVPKRIAALSPRDYAYTQTVPLTIDPYLLGLLLGDGSLGKGTLKFSNTDPVVLARLAECVRPYGLTCVPYGGCDYGLTGDGGPNLLKNALIDLGLWGHNSYQKFIPAHYLTASRKDRMALLAGLIDTDGGVHSYASCSEPLAHGFTQLVHSLGGKATATRRTARCQNGVSVEYTQVYWRLTESLPLACPRKQVNTHTRPIDYTKRICRTVESLGFMDCGDLEVDHPAHCYITGDHIIVSNSKTDTCLVELCIRATGQIPLSLQADYPREKLRGPINCRVVVESITNTLETIILPKLRWENWQGVDEPGGHRGHYGWLPKHCLPKGLWSEAWTARTRTLEVLYHDPDTGAYRGLSRIQFMSYDQDPADFASGDFQFVLHDEPPKEAIWVENLVRAKRVDGTMMLSMTWPDDPTTPVDWIIDRIYEKAFPGKDHDPTYAWFDLFATDNLNLNQTALAELARSLSAGERARRIYGQNLRLSNRVHPLFTDVPKVWCVPCHDLTILDAEGLCGTCHSDDTMTFQHVETVLANPAHPVVCILDPHPRKPHMLLWVQVDPNDDWGVVHELECEGSPIDVQERVKEIEDEYGWTSITRIMDPNMGRSPSGVTRDVTWQDAFEREGLVFDLAEDGAAGRQIVNDYLKPDSTTRRPRLIIDPRCIKTCYQMKRYAWDDHKLTKERDQKQTTKQKYDDFPTCLKYLANRQPDFRALKGVGSVWKRDVGSYLGR